MSHLIDQLGALRNELYGISRGTISKENLSEIDRKVSDFLEAHGSEFFQDDENAHSKLSVIENMRALIKKALPAKLYETRIEPRGPKRRKIQADREILLKKIATISGRLQSICNTRDRRIHDYIQPELFTRHLAQFLEAKDIVKLRAAGTLNKKDMEKAFCVLMNQKSATLVDFRCKTLDEAFKLIRRNRRNIETLDLSYFYKELNHEHLEEIARNFPKLKNLNLGYFEIKDAGLTHLSKLPLQKLHFLYCQEITDNGLKHLSKLPLQYLNIWSLPLVTDAGLEDLRRSHPNTMMIIS